jgi:putative transposase
MRLKDYDYASIGTYFVTVCTADRWHLFGEVIDGRMDPSSRGRLVEECWLDLPNHYAGLVLDAFVLMPNHVHAIIVILDIEADRPSLSEIMRAFKSFTSRRINEVHGTPGAPVWQRGYYEHIVRDATDLEAITRYTIENPGRWSEDRENR